MPHDAVFMAKVRCLQYAAESASATDEKLDHRLTLWISLQQQESQLVSFCISGSRHTAFSLSEFSWRSKAIQYYIQAFHEYYRQLSFGTWAYYVFTFSR